VAVERPSVSTQITTQMIEDGKVNGNKLFIFYFEYSPLSRYCSVDSITVNNTQCSRDALGSGKGFWLKPEHASKEYSGEQFKCRLTQQGTDMWEFVVEDPVDVSGKLIHRVLLRNESRILREIVDYTGQLSKYSNITNRLESVSYRAISRKSEIPWDALDLGCNKMISPVLKK